MPVAGSLISTSHYWHPACNILCEVYLAKRNTSPRILLWDIETVQNLVATFRLWERGGLHLPHTNIIQERYIVCASWKWLGEKQVHSISTLQFAKEYNIDPFNDQYVVEALYQVLDQADIAVAHNGDSYDIKFTKGRILHYGLDPLPPIKTVDTLLAAKRHFDLNSFRLDYLGQYLGVGRKIETHDGLWMRILKGGDDAKAAIREMVRYNKQDVRLLERVFLKLRPYITQINYGLYSQQGVNVCPRCGSTASRSKGLGHADTRTYQRRVCIKCGGPFKVVKSEPFPTVTTRPI